MSALRAGSSAAARSARYMPRAARRAAIRCRRAIPMMMIDDARARRCAAMRTVSRAKRRGVIV